MNREQRMMLGRIVVSATSLFVLMQLKLEASQHLFYILCIYAVIGWDVIYKGIKNLSRSKFLDENFLMLVATAGALFLKEYPEAIEVLLFYQVGELFQDYAVDKSKDSISALMGLRADYANIEKDGEIISVDPASVKIGDIIIVKPGEKIPLDGVIIEGATSLDTAALTGESIPSDVYIGDEIKSGCVNLTGLIKVSVSKVFAESTASKILQLVQFSKDKKATTERFITRFAKYYTPAVVGAAILFAIVPPLMKIVEWNSSIKTAIIFLIISCPCALLVSVPMSFFGSIGAASRSGILVKGSNYLEMMSRAEIAIFDKTGTLSKGVFEVIDVHAFSMSDEHLLEYAVMAEYYSNHPISLSLKEYYNRDIDISRISEFVEIPGQGVHAHIDGKQVYVGNRKMMIDLEAELVEDDHDGNTLHVFIDNVYAGHIVVADVIKDDTAAAIRELKNLGIKRIVMLTGDSEGNARVIARQAGITEYYASLMPEDKLKIIEKIKSENPKKTVIFAGDGINDAPALTVADIGIAMGSIGSDAAIEAADIVVMRDSVSDIVGAIKISKDTNTIVYQNIIFSLAVKLIVIVMGVFGLAGLKSAIFSDVGVTVIVVINALRTLNLGNKKFVSDNIVKLVEIEKKCAHDHSHEGHSHGEHDDCSCGAFDDIELGAKSCAHDHDHSPSHSHSHNHKSAHNHSHDEHDDCNCSVFDNIQLGGKIKCSEEHNHCEHEEHNHAHCDHEHYEHGHYDHEHYEHTDCEHDHEHCEHHDHEHCEHEHHEHEDCEHNHEHHVCCKRVS